MRHFSRIAGVVVLIVVVACVTWFPRPVTAGTELGQFCWRLTPYVDTLRLAITIAPGDVPLLQAQVSWRAEAAQAKEAIAGDSLDTRPIKYQLLGTGTIQESFTQPGSCRGARISGA